MIRYGRKGVSPLVATLVYLAIAGLILYIVDGISEIAGLHADWIAKILVFTICCVFVWYADNYID